MPPEKLSVIFCTPSVAGSDAPGQPPSLDQFIPASLERNIPTFDPPSVAKTVLGLAGSSSRSVAGPRSSFATHLLAGTLAW